MPQALDDEKNGFSSEETRPLTCFVIGPIGNRHAEIGSTERETYEEALAVMEEVIVPACKSVGLDPVRADGLARAGEITDQVFRRLRDDDVVIADLTGANANVMYELGLRHTRDKLTVQVGEFGRLPFDINVIRTVQFSRSTHGLVTARNELTRLLEAGVAGDFDAVSATRIWDEGLDADAGGELSDEGLVDGRPGTAATPNPDDEPGFLDLLAAAEDGQEQATSVMTQLGGAMERMGELARRSTNEMAESDAQGRGMKGRMAVAAKFAAGLGQIAGELEELVGNYVDAMHDVSAGNLVIIERLEQDPAQLEEAEGWTLMTRRLAQTSRGTLGQLNDFSQSLKENAKASRLFREPTNRIVRTLDNFADATGVVDEWDRRLQSLGVPIPPDDWEPNAGGEASG